MRLIREIEKMQNLAKQWKKKGKTIGFVPTMGYLHEGHLSLVRQARKETDIVVMSIYVNPLQFGPKEDFKQYPRDLNRDMKLAEEAGVDIIFAPLDKAMYLQDHVTYVEVEKLTEGLCGRFRPGHFKGVTTVVTKLFNIVKPDIAYFGQKDAQQARVIEKMVEDLNMDIKIRVMPIVREKDGLAMSSRNVYLNPRERERATCLYFALSKAKEMVKRGERNSEKIIEEIKKILVKSGVSRIDYIEVVNAKTLEPVKKIEGKVLIALAVWIGKTRLIDNTIIG
ncbi:MAG: pantoate--beta-alanine ligase [Candidatus Omnitrophica bacterium]|nr:pantoate--beta-alanine ligase [Candidatus Omnitrophota bacterium]MCM8798481.1 pantoate--beta-alanine ligase [Candidatus Omnitrophota bacterium]